MKLNTASFDSTISFFLQGVTLEEESLLDISATQVCYSNGPKRRVLVIFIC